MPSKYLLLSMVFCVSVCAAQKTKLPARPAAAAKTAPQPVKDSFAFMITQAIKKVYQAAADPKKAAAALSTGLHTKSTYGGLVYKTGINTDPYENLLEKGKPDHVKDITRWTWKISFIEAPRGLQAAAINDLKLRVDSIIKTVPVPAARDSKNFTDIVFTYAVVNQSWSDKDILELQLGFYKPNTLTEQQAIDSLLAVYRPMFYGSNNQVEQAAKELPVALMAEGITDEKINNLFVQELKAVANTSTYAAYLMILNVSAPVQYDGLKSQLTASQQQAVARHARDLLNGNAGKTTPAAPQPTPVTPAAVKEKPLKYTQVTSFTRRNSSDYNTDHYLAGYDKEQKKYLMLTREYVPAKKTFFKTNENIAHYNISSEYLTEEEVEKIYTSTGKHYKICGMCGATGVIYKTETRTKGGWEQVNFNVYYYSTPRVTAQWQERDTCPNCLGSGVTLTY